MITQLTSESPPRPFLWTSEEFQRMGELGFFIDKRVELIEGEILQMSPMGAPHVVGILLLTHELPKLVGSNYCVLIQGPLEASAYSQPMPDGMILRGAPRDFKDSLPSNAVLVIEVADSSLHFDRTVKAKLYSAANVPEYWIINLADKVIEVMRDPAPDADYKTKSVAKAGDTLTLVAAPEISISSAPPL